MDLKVFVYHQLTAARRARLSEKRTQFFKEKRDCDLVKRPPWMIMDL